jgi:hypothetical protein
MDKPEKIIVRTVAFFVSTVLSVSLFALFSSWAWTHLDPTQQDAIGAINTPWITARSDRATPVSAAATAHEERMPDYRAVTTRVAHRH